MTTNKTKSKYLKMTEDEDQENECMFCFCNVNVKEKHRLTHCWQTKYMHEMKYPYSVDKYSE